MDPSTSRTTWRALEPVHAMVYFAPEAQEEYAALGLDVAGNRALGYFPARAAALGRVGPGTVQATFFNFSRLAVEFGMAGRLGAGVARAARRGPPPRRRPGAAPAVRRPAGRPGVARGRGAGAHRRAGLHAVRPAAVRRPRRPARARAAAPAAVARDHPAARVPRRRARRGAGRRGRDRPGGRRPARRARRQLDPQGPAAHPGVLRRGVGRRRRRARARAAGCSPDGTFTDEGRAHRQRVEDLTDVLALPAWERLGEQGCARLRELVQPAVGRRRRRPAAWACASPAWPGRPLRVLC